MVGGARMPASLGRNRIDPGMPDIASIERSSSHCSSCSRASSVSIHESTSSRNSPIVRARELASPISRSATPLSDEQKSAKARTPASLGPTSAYEKTLVQAFSGLERFCSRSLRERRGEDGGLVRSLTEIRRLRPCRHSDGRRGATSRGRNPAEINEASPSCHVREVTAYLHESGHIGGG